MALGIHISPEKAPLVALLSSFCFATASFIYRRLATQISPLWMNCFKATCALIFFSAFLLLQPALFVQPQWGVVLLLLLSGFIGLNLGDFFMLSSYRAIGSGRTMMITAFNPIFLSFAGAFLFGDALNSRIFLAVLCLSFVLLALGHESYRTHKRWTIQGYAHALTAALFDAMGILITRQAFVTAPLLDPFMANWLRLLGAMLGFIILHLFYKRIGLIKHFKELSPKNRGFALFASFLGTFFALALWLTAIRRGHMGLVSAMGGFGPLYATGVECIMQRKRPGPHLFFALICFICGFLLVVFPF